MALSAASAVSQRREGEGVFTDLIIMAVTIVDGNTMTLFYFQFATCFSFSGLCLLYFEVLWSSSCSTVLTLGTHTRAWVILLSVLVCPVYTTYSYVSI